MRALIDAAKSAGLVWVFTTVGLFVPGMLGWIAEVSSWAEQKGAPAFPDPSNLGYLFVAALTAAFPAAVAGLVRYIENLTGKQMLPRTAASPVYTPQHRGQAGAANTRTIALVALVVAVVVLLVILL